MGLHRSLSMLVHGPSKAGKSLLSVSTPAPRVLFDVEAAARFLPLRSVTWDPIGPPPVHDGTWDTAVIEVREWQDAVRGMTWLKSGNHPFVSASLDSVSEIQNHYLEAAAGRNAVKIAEWGAAYREIGGFVRDLRELTRHRYNPLTAVVVTSMTKVKPDGRSYPFLQGQMQDVVPYLMDITAYIDVVAAPDGTEMRQLYTRKTPKYLAGERVNGRIPPVLNLPIVYGETLEQIIASNTMFSQIIDHVYAHFGGVSAPAVVDTTPSPLASATQFMSQADIDAITAALQQHHQTEASTNS